MSTKYVHPMLAGKLFYVGLLAGKKIADLGLLVKLTLVPPRWIETRLKKLIIAGQNSDHIDQRYLVRH